MVSNPGTVSTENIDEVILRLLKIKSGTEIDYQTYFNAIKKRLAAHRMVGAEIPIEEDQLLREELKRVGKLKDKGRFKVKSKKAKISTEPSFSGGQPKSSLKNGAIIKAPPGGKITPDKLRPPQVEPVNVKDITEKTAAISKGSSPLGSINKKLDSIISTLLNVDKENKKEKERQRRESESKKRSEREKGLESKTFDGLKKAVSAITKPFQSIWDRIFNFIFYTLLGRVMMKLFDWFADPKNKDKIQSLIRFVKDWWPALLGSYILFGTSFGKLVRSLTGMVGRFIFQIGKVAIPKLLGVIARNPVASLLVGGAVAAGVGAYTASQQNEERREEFKKKDSSIVTPRETKETGKTPGTSQLLQEQSSQRGLAMFNGGGFANFSKMFGGAAMGAGLGSMFGPMGTLLGAGLGGAAGSGMFSGFVSGEKGVDKVPAMLSDGEFVMSAGAVQKYGVDTFEAMNAAGGGTNKPKIVNGTTYAAGGGYMGDYMSGQVKLRPASMFEMTGESSTLRNLLGVRTKEEAARIVRNAGNKVPDVKALLGDAEFSRLEQGHLNKYSEGADEKTFKGLRRIYQQHFGVGEEFSKMMSNRVDAEMLRRSSKPTSTPKPRATIRTLPASRMLPAAGESSANAMRAAAKAAQNVRAPIPATSAIVPYTGGGLARTGVTAGLSVPQIRTNMNVPGGRIRGGSLSAILAAFEMKQRMDEGQTATQAGLGAGGSALGGQLGWMAGAKAGALAGAALGSIVPGLGTGVGAAVGAIVGGLAAGYGGAMLGGKLADDLSGVNALKERMSRGGVGGAIKGGYGLKGQSFKDAPKTMVMTDEKGRPFVGHKAMRNGQLTYVRPPTPGTGTTNPLEMLGRFINPGAYKENDQRVAMKNQKIAMVNALESFQKQGMAPDAQARMIKQMGGNLKDVQNDLNYRKKRESLISQGKLKSNGAEYTAREKMRMSISSSQAKKSAPKPLPKPQPKSQIAGGGMNGRRGSGSSPSTQKAPSPSPRHKAGTKTTEKTTGTKR